MFIKHIERKLTTTKTMSLLKLNNTCTTTKKKKEVSTTLIDSNERFRDRKVIESFKKLIAY